MDGSSDRYEARLDVMRSALAAYRERVERGEMTETEYAHEEQIWQEALDRITAVEGGPQRS